MGEGRGRSCVWRESGFWLKILLSSGPGVEVPGLGHSSGDSWGLEQTARLLGLSKQPPAVFSFSLLFFIMVCQQSALT